MSEPAPARIDAVVVTAMADESAPFLERAERVGDAVRVAHAVQRTLTVRGREVLLVQCGIGLVNAASATAVAIHLSAPRTVISAGSAGGMGAAVRVGDVVVGDRYVYAGADARAFGYALGQVPGMPPVYEGHPELVAAAGAEHPGLRVHIGTMLSGDSFVDATSVDAVREAFPHALSTDMESTALAQTAHVHGVPFVSVRGVSDLCGPVAGEDFLAHVDDAAVRSADVVLRLLAALGDAG
ncbi:MAG TPA: 5'-methylthioadenosine/S-adenosylhomocysteine nucleosidase [Actinotalea sp.]|nr:5'-methylthioadenosine/S-adenosylhomocysteine nucleosidase [Actinotalea sp.]